MRNKPLISYTIEASLKSTLLTDVVVSTDSELIKKVAEDYGAKVPFLRPENLSGDLALAIPTIQHALLSYEKIKNITYDFVIMLQPTAPLRSDEDIDNSLKLLLNENIDSVISVVDVDNFHPMKMKVIKHDLLEDYDRPPTENPPRQTLPDVYIVNGAIYATKRNILMEDSSFRGDKCKPYIMPRNRSVNIDNIEDFIVAEYFLSNK